MKKKRKAKFIKDPKARGEWVESVFMARAGEHGLAVSKPWGDSTSFDFVVGQTRRFFSVQVKSTTAASGGGYVCAIRRQGRAYERGAFDFVAAYVVPEDAWYIIPVEAMRGKECVTLCSNAKQANYEKYREAWHLLRESSEIVEEGASGGDGPSAAETNVPVVSPLPAGAVGRIEASMNFVRRHFERTGGLPGKTREDG
jgi:hypothetical protein